MQSIYEFIVNNHVNIQKEKGTHIDDINEISEGDYITYKWKPFTAKKESFVCGKAKGSYRINNRNSICIPVYHKVRYEDELGFESVDDGYTQSDKLFIVLGSDNKNKLFWSTEEEIEIYENECKKV